MNGVTNYKTNQISSLFKGSEGWFNALLGCVWGYHLLVVVNAAVLRIPGLSVIGGAARDIVIIVLFLFSIKSLSRRIFSIDILFYLLFFVFYLLQFVFYPDNYEVLSKFMFTVFLVAIPMYFIGYVIDIKKLYDLFLVFSIGCILFNSFLRFIYSSMVGQESSELVSSMGVSYRLLPHVLFVFWHFFKTRKIFSLAIFVMGLLLLLSYGSRGPIVCLAFFIIFFLLSSNGKRKWWVVSIVVIVAGFAVTYFDLIALFLDSFFSDFGASTRLTNQVLSDTWDDDSGRGDIIKTLKMIMDTGDNISYGIFGSYKYVGTYAHRFYWDFWFSFGYIGGTIIMVLLALLFINGKKKCITSEEKVFWLLLFSNSIIGLLFSNCYIFDGSFYLFLGYCVSRIRNYKSEMIEMQYENSINS